MNNPWNRDGTSCRLFNPETILMKKNSLMPLLATSAVVGLAVATHAATIIEPHESGALYENFENVSGGGSLATTAMSSAVGRSAGLTHSLLGEGADAQLWHFYFTPGSTPTNFTPEAGTALTNATHGAGYVASGLSQSDLPDGGTGEYRVFATWAWSDLPNNLTTFSVLDGDGVTLSSITLDQRPGSDWFGAGNGEGNAYINGWGLLGTVMMQAGETYTLAVSSDASGSGYSQFITGVMFEPIPEPSTYAAIFGGLVLLAAGLQRYRRNRA